MTAEEMTPQELRLLADQKEGRERERQRKVIRTGVLKHDLFFLEWDDCAIPMSREELDDHVSSSTKLSLHKGLLFESHMVEDFNNIHDRNAMCEMWDVNAADLDEIYRSEQDIGLTWFSMQPNEWAAANLENIKEVAR